jgi:hypothetical protein
MLRVADIATKVVCDEPDVPLAVADPISRFLVPDGPADATIRVSWAPRLTDPGGEKLFDSGVVWRLHRERDAFIFSFVSPALGPAPYRLARFDASFSSGQIWLNRACLRDGVVLQPLDYPLDELIMINLLARGRGVEVHGCGVIDRDGVAYLFAGQSGAGKSTIARLWHDQGATILSDDRVILRLRTPGTGAASVSEPWQAMGVGPHRKAREVWMYGTPWHGEKGFSCPASAPLAGLFFLQHGLSHDVRRTLDARAASRLFSCAFPPFHDKEGLDFTVGLLARIVDRVPCFELTFVPDASVVDVVRGHL